MLWLAGFLSGESPVVAKSPVFDSRDDAAVAAFREHAGRQAVVARVTMNGGKPTVLEVFEVSRSSDGTIVFVSFPDLTRLGF